jgi:hypothetical protein
LRDTFGKNIVPLSIVGYFLNNVGATLLSHIYHMYSNQEKECRIFYPMHRAINIQLRENGVVLTKVEKTSFHIKIVKDHHELQQLIESSKTNNFTI